MKRSITLAQTTLLVVVTVFAAGLRLYRCGDPLWLDELHTAWAVSDSFGEVAPRARIGNQSPIFFYITWASTRLFGMNEVAVRLPSLIFGVALVPTLFGVTLHWTRSTTAAVLAAVLAAIDRDFLFYAQEARPYAAVQLVAVIQVVLFTRLIISDKATQRYKKRAIFVAASVLLVYLHYTAGLLIAGEVIAYITLASLRRPLQYPKSHFVIDLVVIAFLCLPLAPHLVEIAARRDNWDAFADVSLRWALRMVDVYLLWPLGTLIVLSIGTRLFLGRWSFDANFGWELVVVLTCWLVFPVAFAWIATYSGGASLAMLRFVIVSTPAAVVLASVICAAFSAITSRVLFAIVVLIASLTNTDIDDSWRRDRRLVADRNEDWAGIVEAINDEKQLSHRPVLLCPGLIEDYGLADAPDDELRRYCLFPITGIYRIETHERELFALPTEVSEFELDQHVHTLITRAEGAWLIVRSRKHDAIEIAKSVARNDWKAELDRSLGGVHLFRIDVTK